MSDKVIRIGWGILDSPDAEPVPQVVTDLRGLLAEAEAGRLTAFALAALTSDGGVLTVSSFADDMHPDHYVTPRLYYAVGCLSQRLKEEG